MATSEAYVLDPPSTRSESDEWLASASDKVAAIAAEFPAPSQLETADDYRQAKRDRAALRRRIAELEADRKSMTAAIEEAVRDFKGRAKTTLQPLADIDQAYKSAISDFDDWQRSKRANELRGAYEDFAPALVPLVPFDRLVEKYAGANGWFSASTTLAAAQMDLCACVSAIAEDEKRLLAMDWADDDERDAARAEFFSSLDLADAIRAVQDRRKARENVAALDESRDACRTEQTPAMAAALRARDAVQEKARRREEREAAAPSEVRAVAYTIRCSLTDAQRDALLGYLRSIGVSGTIRRS